jgi:hypothetical protein
MSEYQDEVLTSLLDLQAELRGDEPAPHDAIDREAADALSDPVETIAVTEEGVTVSVDATPIEGQIEEWSVNDRIAALNERLARLEYHLAGVTKRIERIEPERVMEVGDEGGPDVDARWRSFLDLQKIVADRLERR